MKDECNTRRNENAAIAMNDERNGLPNRRRVLREAATELAALKERLAKFEAIARKVRDSADSDWWAEREQLDKTTPYELEIQTGLLWEIDELLKEG